MKRSADDASLGSPNRRILAEERFAACCAGCRKALTDEEAKSWHDVDSACVDSDTGVARLEHLDKDVVCYFQSKRWRFCYCQHCKKNYVAIRGVKLVSLDGSTRCVSDSDCDSEQDEWEQEQETIANLSEYQEGLQRIWNTAEGVLGEEKYEHFYSLFNNFMMDKMRMKRVFPASGEGASAETETQEKRKRRW